MTISSNQPVSNFTPLRVAGVDNISDVLTKSLAAPIIAKLRPGLTGYEQLPPPPPRPRE